MAGDMFLKLKTIDGESKDEKHQNEIDVESFSWGVSQPGTFGTGGGGGAGKANFSDFSIAKFVDKSSHRLLIACATGEHIGDGTFFIRKAGGKQEEYVKYTFTDLLVSSYQLSGSGERPMESISLNFAKVKMEYAEQKADGSMAAFAQVEYDLKANKKV
ncbi:type VI secretion system tube protein Hcp [Chelativorans sp. AA-79]|uniref:Hcp family type VI secretion system effector n=1 Tax=Chelativorans sp. AA-79 TaxID=3028735 RepID=UPI0023F707DC|nr:type VI secretion system tube protein Hcp [Chelativorans sp. AA-79]WEX10873.1 type VI secretion system tube protein Hcp [Chelativorans sp. AA-79]